ncbi:hypothetical protein [Tropicibacter sp. S64]|uniref:hypothetical protein n=1 Tax=Tropicibacter sp. S64 TaxID=3415122 RepID=UPI003C7AFCAF
MKDMAYEDHTVSVAIAEDPQGWAPREAPLDMPCQVLERPAFRFDLGLLIRLLTPGQRI